MIQQINIAHPDDAGYAANIKGMSTVVESHFAFAGDYSEPPKKIFAKLSRFVFVVSDKNATIKSTKANLKTADFPAFYRKAQKCYDNYFENRNGLNAVAEGNEELSPAYKVQMTTGQFKGKTPASILLENPGNAKMLTQHYRFLEENVSKYPNNKIQMEAIIDAANLARAGKLIGKEAPATISGRVTVHSSGPRPLMSEKVRNGKNFIYELSVYYSPAMNYPFEIEISNYYAPVIKKESGQLNVSIKDKEDLTGKQGSATVRAMSLSADDFYNILDEMRAELEDFRVLYSGKAQKMANDIRLANRNEALKNANAAG